MSLLKYLKKRKDTASVAKERLQIIISHERSQRNTAPDYLEKMQREILEVISQYIKIDLEQIKVHVDRIGDNAVLELNVTMPDPEIPQDASTKILEEA